MSSEKSCPDSTETMEKDVELQKKRDFSHEREESISYYIACLDIFKGEND
jgi:hypothetical protein